MAGDGDRRQQPARLSFQPRAPRWSGWAEVSRLCCPAGHHIREDAWIFGHGALRCKWRPGVGQPECGRLVLVVSTTLAPGDGRPTGYYLAEVTWPELKAIRDEHLSGVAAFRRLGLTINPEHVGLPAPEGGTP